MSESTPASSNTSPVDGTPPSWRIAPSIPVAFGVFIAYVLVFTGLSATSGIGYDDWFASSGNILRSAVVPLIGGSLVLVAFLAWARWDFVFRDPERLPVPRTFGVIVVVYLVAVAAQFAAADWGGGMDRLVPIIAAAILVGFAEETLFRGIILRSLRTNLRPEAWVVLISAVWFGLFHLTNILNGANVISVGVQVFTAAGGGVVYYVFRRFRGTLVLAMLAHGLWDGSAFLPPAVGALANVGRITFFVALILGVVGVIVVLRNDRSYTVTRGGIQRR